MLTQPNENINLPQNIKKHVEKVQSQLAVNEQEVLILQKSKYGLKTEIEALINQRNELNGKITNVMNILNELMENKNTIEKDVKDLSKTVSTEKDNMEKRKLEIDVKEEDLKTRMIDLNELFVKCHEAENKNVLKEDKLNIKEKEINEFVGKLRELLKNNCVK